MPHKIVLSKRKASLEFQYSDIDCLQIIYAEGSKDGNFSEIHDHNNFIYTFQNVDEIAKYLEQKSLKIRDTLLHKVKIYAGDFYVVVDLLLSYSFTGFKTKLKKIFEDYNNGN